MKKYFPKKDRRANRSKAFTLIELLLVIGIIATLAVVVFVALDPAKRFSDARNARRQADVETILSAVHQYIIDNKGGLPAGLSQDETMIGNSSTGCSNNYSGGCQANSDGCLDLSNSLSSYLKSIPYDSQTGSDGTTEYTIVADENGIVTVRACSAEGTEIFVSR